MKKGQQRYHHVATEAFILALYVVHMISIIFCTKDWKYEWTLQYLSSRTLFV